MVRDVRKAKISISVGRRVDRTLKCLIANHYFLFVLIIWRT